MTVDTSEAERQITVFKGEANAESASILTDAEGYQKQRSINAQAEAYTIVS